MIIVSHDIALIASFADRIVVLRDGKLIEQGSVSAITKLPADSYTQHLMMLSAQRSII